MNQKEILLSLCYHDERNPLNTGDAKPPRQETCLCDNCYYGKDKLAMEILRLQGIIENYRKVVCNS